MKKALLISSIVIIILTIAIGFIIIQSQPNPRVAKHNDQAQWAIQELLKMRDEKSLDTLVMGTMIDKKRWDFRGVTRQGDSGLPIYGVVKLVCNKPQKRISCWELDILNKNGRDWNLVKSAVNIINNIEEDNTNSKITDTTKKDKKDISEVIIKEIWVVKGNSVNGRAGPGTKFKVTRKIGPDITMEIIETKDGWGRYKIVSENKNAEYVWIWKDLTKVLR